MLATQKLREANAGGAGAVGGGGGAGGVGGGPVQQEPAKEKVREERAGKGGARHEAVAEEGGGRKGHEIWKGRWWDSGCRPTCFVRGVPPTISFRDALTGWFACWLACLCGRVGGWVDGRMWRRWRRASGSTATRSTSSWTSR